MLMDPKYLALSWNSNPNPVLAGNNAWSTNIQNVSFQYPIRIFKVNTHMWSRYVGQVAIPAQGTIAFNFPLSKGQAQTSANADYLNVPCWTDRLTTEEVELYVPAGATFGLVATGEFFTTLANPANVAVYCSFLYQEEHFKNK